MGDEDGSQELPQRSRGTARDGSERSAQSVSPVLSEELRQRMQAAVKAERAEAAAKERSTAPERSERPTLSAAADSGAQAPAVNGAGGVRKRERAARPERLAKPEPQAKPERLRKAEPKAKPERPAEPKAAVTAKPGEQPERAARNGTGVKLQAAADRPAAHKPAAPGHGRAMGRGRTSPPARPAESVRKKPRNWHLAQVGLAILALALVAAGALGTAALWHSGGSPSGNSGPTAAALQRQEATTRSQAASWVVQQVSQDDSVSCDQVMCAALRAARFPASKLLVLEPASQPQMTSAVVVVTQVVRDLFGSSIESAWAPAVLASFGDGAAEVSIRVVAPHGALTYFKQLNSGQADRALNGKSLEAFPQITFSASAQAALAAGQVDPRLWLALAYLADDEPPIHVVDFGNVGPGTGPGLLLRYADLDANGQAAKLTNSAYVQAMRAVLSKADEKIRPASSQLVTPPGGGADVFRIEFTAPSPLTSVDGTP
jgi:hypothetical protein